jgi:hypothetical protein
VVLKKLAWVRAKKTEMSSLGTWERYAVLQACKLMPRDEREAWSRSVAARDDVERVLLKWLAKP